MKRRVLLALFSILIFSGLTSAQVDAVRLRLMEDSLYRVMKTLQGTRDAGDRNELNNAFSGILQRTLTLEGSFEYPFDSLRFMSRLTSPDRMFRIYNWNLPDSTGKNTYFAFIQWDAKHFPGKPLLVLHDYSDSLRDPDHAMVDGNHWFGVLYYKIIPMEAGGRKYYTLLGWDGGDPVLTCKVIDVFSWQDNGKELFGANIFQGYDNDKHARIIFRYSPSATMSLKYQEQFVTLGKKWNPRKKQFDYNVKKEWVIVFDRLVPLYQGMEGEYRYYVPAGDAFDGFTLAADGWHFVSGIDARNRQ